MRWGTRGRGRSRLGRDGDEDVAADLNPAISARTEATAAAVLLRLNGVEVPVAVGTLIAIDPNRCTAIDFRALKALGGPRLGRSVNFYLSSLNARCGLAHKEGVSLRDSDRPRGDGQTSN